MDGDILDRGRVPLPLTPNSQRRLTRTRRDDGALAALRNDAERAAGHDEIEEVPAADDQRDVGLIGLGIDPVDGDGERDEQHGEDDEERPADFRQAADGDRIRPWPSP